MKSKVEAEGDSEMMDSGDYEDFDCSESLRFLTETDDVRIEEEMIRPRVEIWPDDFEWQQWVSQHDDARRSMLCLLPSMKASPFCAYGYH